jgi:hypothetical protein
MLLLQVVTVLSLGWWCVQGLLFLRGRGRVGRVGQLPHEDARRWPRVSVIVPARDEALHLEASVQSRLLEGYPDVELVVVDDRSTDGTGTIAEGLAVADPRVRVVHVTELPHGWLGKVYAMARGLERATGEWVLFSDADIVVRPGTLRRVMADAERRSLDFVTVFPGIELTGFALALTLGPLFRVLVLGSRPWAVRDPASSAFMGVGAFNLVRRAALDRTEGLEWLRLETGDDVALGAMLKRSGARCEVWLGGDEVRLEFYPSWRAMVRAVEKNGGGAPFLALAAVVALVVVLELGFLGGVIVGGPWLAAALAGLVGSGLLAHAVARWLSVPSQASVIAAVGALPFAFVMLRSATLALVRGGVRWRDTFYPLDVIASGRRLFRAPPGRRGDRQPRP